VIKIDSFGLLIHKARVSKSLTKSELSRRVGITPQYVTDIENGRTVPSEGKLELLVNILELNEKDAFKLADKIPLRIIEKAKKEFYGT
jgi:transcriptional regulator with XRE-family HTH domain